MSKDYAPPYIDLDFDGIEKRCFLTLEEIAKVQYQRKCGIGELYRRVCIDSHFYWEDLLCVVTRALIGGGMEPKEVGNFLETWMPKPTADRPSPLEVWHSFAASILMVTMHGYQPPEGAPGNGEGAMTTGGSTSPEHTD